MHVVNADKLKMAQVIEREARMNKAWQEEDESSEEEASEKKHKAPKAKEAKRPNAQKFSEIMKNTDAFPSLENQFADSEESDN